MELCFFFLMALLSTSGLDLGPITGFTELLYSIIKDVWWDRTGRFSMWYIINDTEYSKIDTYKISYTI